MSPRLICLNKWICHMFCLFREKKTLAFVEHILLSRKHVYFLLLWEKIKMKHSTASKLRTNIWMLLKQTLQLSVTHSYLVDYKRKYFLFTLVRMAVLPVEEWRKLWLLFLVLLFWTQGLSPYVAQTTSNWFTTLLTFLLSVRMTVWASRIRESTFFSFLMIVFTLYHTYENAAGAGHCEPLTWVLDGNWTQILTRALNSNWLLLQSLRQNF